MTEVLISAGLVLGAFLWVLLSRHLARVQRFDYFEPRKWAPMDHDWRFGSHHMRKR